jgi:hypothetical protein
MCPTLRLVPELSRKNSDFRSCYPKFPNKIRILGNLSDGSGVLGLGIGLRFFLSMG